MSIFLEAENIHGKIRRKYFQRYYFLRRILEPPLKINIAFFDFYPSLKVFYVVVYIKKKYI